MLQILGIVVRECIPDRPLNEADEVKVVDVTPATHEERLIEGKIYAPEKSDQALQNFFQRRNLIALQELALREVADNIAENNDTTVTEKRYCNIHQRVMVCLSTCSQFNSAVALWSKNCKLHECETLCPICR